VTEKKENLAGHFIGQLDTLVAFLALAHDEVFEVVRSEYDNWVPSDQHSTLPNSFAIYQTQVSHAAFLLGFSYFEAFLTDVVHLIFRRRPVILPKDRKISFGEIMSGDPGRDVIEVLIEKEVQDVFFAKSFGDIAAYFDSRLNITWPSISSIPKAKALRNCIIHNMARADARLAETDPTRWRVGDEIAMTPSEVHAFGLDARRFARELWPQVQRQQPNDPNQD